MSFTVTATQVGAPDVGMQMDIVVLTGFATSPIGASNAVHSTTPAVTLTPTGTGSRVYGSVLGLAGTFTPNGSTSVKADTPLAGLECTALWSSGTTTAGTPVTIGGTLTANGISACALEIRSGSGIVEDASSPGAWPVSGNTAVTSGSFNPPAGSLLVVMVQSNGNSGVNTMALTDSSGLGLTWVEQVKSNAAGTGYNGIWTAQMPLTLFKQGAVSGSAGGGGTSATSWGVQFSVSASATHDGMWFYSPPGDPTSVLPDTIGCYEVSGGTLIASNAASWSGAPGSGWVFAAFTSPPTLTPGTAYKGVIHNPLQGTNWFVDAAGYWASGAGASGITNGILSAPSDSASASGQMSYTGGSSLAYPSTSGAGFSLWVDVQVTPAPVAPAPITVVQSASSPDLSGTSTLTSGLTLGNWLLMIGAVYGHTGIQPPDNPRVGGTLISSPATLLQDSTAGTASVAYAMWLVQISGANAGLAGGTVLTFDQVVDDGIIKCWGIEVSSATALSLDKTAQFNVVSGGTSATAGPTAGVTASGELAVFTFPVNAVNPNVSSGGWTIIGGQNYAVAGYQLLGAAGSTATVTGSISASGHDAAIGLVTVKAATGGGSAHSLGASLTITPSYSAGRIRGHTRQASLSPSPALSAGRVRGRFRAAALSVTPVFSAGRVRGRLRSAALSVVSTLTAGRVRGHKRGASLSPSPVMHVVGVVGGVNVQTMNLSATIECGVNVGLTLEATIECRVGVPYQGGIRNLAADRWMSMYPS